MKELDYLVTAQGMIAALGWLIVAVGATVAVFSPRIRDTAAERIGLSLVAITSLGAAYRIVGQGWESDGDLFLALSLAFYVGALFVKHLKKESTPRPADKTRPMDLT